MASKRYPLGIQTFSEIVKGNYFYADKTAIVYQLAHYAKFHFLSNTNVLRNREGELLLC